MAASPATAPLDSVLSSTFEAAVHILNDNITETEEYRVGRVGTAYIEVLCTALQEVVNTPDYPSQLLQHHTRLTIEVILWVLQFEDKATLVAMKISTNLSEVGPNTIQASSSTFMPSLIMLAKGIYPLVHGVEHQEKMYAVLREPIFLRCIFLWEAIRRIRKLPHRAIGA
ncbi:hypothetical protein BDV98DRAFT_564338 [Pterulicium gracile]|uniref:Uncharacterized protein n=1 Tax=Pterulicium gracile TaxID=1884261 RepID=A0A5C3QNG5_9AGAR|nr:hypothetical protein BDV98DRAFT_564338 [Pterula gracilis]